MPNTKIPDPQVFIREATECLDDDYYQNLLQLLDIWGTDLTGINIFIINILSCN